MAATPTDATAAISGDVVVVPRRRGKSTAPNFTYEGPVSVIRLELDVTDAPTRRRMARQWAAVFRLRRALQRDAAARCRASWAAHHERAHDPKAARERLGLSRNGIEAAAKSHIEASGWMRDHLTKAIGLHVADEVWETVDRHLFADASGRRHGPPRIGAWWDFTRIPGRARSHTKDRPVWETYRLVGSLDGHLAGYRHPQLPAAVTTATAAAARPAGTSILAQPPGLPVPVRPASAKWADHHGVLAVVFTGLPGGDLVLPVRLPQGAGRWAHLSHFLADPAVWHKIDLVRVRDRKAPGGWCYYAHLLVHQAGYQAQATRSYRAAIPTGRRAGVDANVSNLALASFPAGHPERLAIDQITCDAEQQKAAVRAAKRARERQRALDRSRRNTNADQYHPSQRQQKRATRRTAKALPAKQVTNPGGPRHARADGVPLRAYRHDTVSGGYQRTHADHATEVRSVNQDCPHCGLHADRDIVSAALAACVELGDPDDPRTARVDYRLAHALRAGLASQQEREGSVNRHQPPVSPDPGSARAGSHHPVASAEQAALGPPPNRPDTPGRRGPSRKQPAPKLIGAA
jgi:hypothetical protein